MTRILVVEDDTAITEGLRFTLDAAGFEVDVVQDGESALQAIRTTPPEVVILDLGLPGLDGLEVLKRLRQRGPSIAVLVLTARSMELDKVRALDLGADDYVTKPFGLAELMARIRALLRRPASQDPARAKIVFGEIEVDPRRYTAMRAGRPLELTAREFRLLEYLFHNRGLVLSREQILDNVWGRDCASGPRTVDVHLAKLRKKIERQPDDPKHLVTVRAAGYTFRV
ncbi:MAG: response regulator transcription factor [Candidatus Wallbacteria bacterium]|nr:response regulator transcription factor [Candidatus Wallbacteria bacterium]